MNKMTQAVKTMTKAAPEDKNQVTNFMGGTSYEVNPLETMKMVTASSIFGEPQYYRDGKFAKKTCHTDSAYTVHDLMEDIVITSMDKYKGMNTSDIMEKVIDDALRFDFKATLEWAAQLRKDFLMRLNPQVIMVRAAMMTDTRKAFTAEYPSLFSDINMQVMARGDDVVNQLTYWLFIHNGSKSSIPGILKNSWKKRINSMSRYELAKYKDAGIGLIDTIRICHAHNKHIDELMQTRNLVMPEEDKTWDVLRNAGKSWGEILATINMNHMALLRNLRAIFSEISDITTVDKILKHLEKGVPTGKQFPFRYMSAANVIAASNNQTLEKNKTAILDSLNNCLDIACNNLPHLAGNNAFLSDNSGSAWGNCTSEYGSVHVAEIGNLSSIIGAANSDRGTVFTFGDKLKSYPISKRNGILTQAKEINANRGEDVGLSTENGIWLFFKDTIDNKIVYDNIFIYSDMQAGHGGLYGRPDDAKEYIERGYGMGGHHIYHTYINVPKLIEMYRKVVNPKVNVYCIQTAGYNNVLIPENGYRTNILYGWTGKELVYADIMNRLWDEHDKQHCN